MKIRLAILDKDAMYLERFMASFSKMYADKVELYCFTDQEIALSRLEESRIEVFIASDFFTIDVSKLPRKCAFAYFVDTPDIEVYNEERTVCKFQRADMIYKEVLGIYSERIEDATKFKFAGDNTTKIIVFEPVSGGVGSSTMAVAATKYIARAGKRALYINMEEFGDNDGLFDGEGQFGFSDVIYALKSKRSNLLLKLESIVRQDSSGAYYFASAKKALDIIDLTKDDIVSLLHEIKLSGAYDYIMIDIDFSVKDACLEMLKEANRIIFVSDGSEVAINKFLRVHKTLELIEEQTDAEILSKAEMIYNKFSNKSGKVLDNDFVEVIGGAPKIEQATNLQIVDRLVAMNLFSKLLLEE